MFYQLQGNTQNPIGILNSSANCIILEEYLGSGTANQGSKGDTGPTGSSGGVVVQYVYNSSLLTNYLNTIPANPENYYIADNYNSSITPQSNLSNIKVTFKVKYTTSDIESTKLTIGILRNINGNSQSIGEDSLCGTINGSGTLVNTYTFTYMDTPASTEEVNYQLYYQLEGISQNLLGINGSSANCIILEEYLGSGSANQGSTGPTGPTGFNPWTSNAVNSIQYNGIVNITGGNLTTSVPYGVTYNFYNSFSNALTSNSSISSTYAYTIIYCNINSSNPEINLESTNFNTGDWVIIVNLSNNNLNIVQNGIYLYTITSNTSLGGATSNKFIFDLNGYSIIRYNGQIGTILTYNWLIV
jgi:hypothetical protein